MRDAFSFLSHQQQIGNAIYKFWKPIIPPSPEKTQHSLSPGQNDLNCSRGLSNPPDYTVLIIRREVFPNDYCFGIFPLAFQLLLI